MKSLAIMVTLSSALAVSATGAQARGCIKGAIVGGIAGHFAHHGLAGAAAGCAVGHHMAHRRDVTANTAGTYAR